MRRLVTILLLLVSPFVSFGQMQQAIATAMYVPTAAASGPPTTNLWAYYEADAGITQILNRVSQWNDLSGNGRHLVQAVALRQPLWNGSNAITFTNSSNEYLTTSGTLTQQFEIYIVASSSNAGASGYFFTDNTPGSGYMIAVASGTLYLSTDGTAHFASTTFSSSNTYALFTGVFNSGSSSIQVNNVAAGTGNAGTASFVSPVTIPVNTNVGDSPINIKGIYIYQGAVTDAAVKAYTTTKWGLP